MILAFAVKKSPDRLLSSHSYSLGLPFMTVNVVHNGKPGRGLDISPKFIFTAVGDCKVVLQVRSELLSHVERN